MNLFDIRNLIAQSNYLATMMQQYQIAINKNIEENHQQIKKGKIKSNQFKINPEEASYDQKCQRYQENDNSQQSNQHDYQDQNIKNQDIYYSSQSHYQYSQTASLQQKVLSDHHSYFYNQSASNMNFPQIQLCDYPTTYPKSQKDKQNQKKIQNIEKSVDKCLQALKIGWHMNQRFIQHEERKKEDNINKMNHRRYVNFNKFNRKVNFIKKQIKRSD